MHIAFKVNITTIKGLTQGVPALLTLFESYKVKADFMFSFGIEDNKGFIKRLLCRTDKMVLQEAKLFQQVTEQGHYAGIYSYNPQKWFKKVTKADDEWVENNLNQAAAAFMQIFDRQPKSHSAAGWQIHPEMLLKEREIGLLYASDTRGKYPFLPSYRTTHGKVPQIPVTLSTFSELLNQKQWTIDNLHEALFDEIQYILPYGHVFELDAEQAGVTLIEALEKVLVVWKGCQAEFGALRDLYQQLDLEKLPRHEVGWGEQAGFKGFVAMQSNQIS